MSSTERAPEPTMEEILASIRRIISDDEASSVQQRATSAEYAEQVRADDTEDGAADTQMIDDIARVLSGSTSPASNDDDDIEDILDLTEPGGSAADEVMMADEPATILEEVVLETEVYTEEPRKLDFSAAFPPANEDRPESPFSFAQTGPTFVEEAAPSYEEEAASSYEEEIASSYQEEVAATYEPEPPPIVEMPAPEPVKAAEPLPSLDDPTTALERAIAALKAGDLAAFAREAQSDYTAPEPLYTPYTPPEPVAEAASAETSFEPEPASFESEPAMVVEEEMVVVEPEPEFQPEPEPEPVVPSWAAESSSWSRMEPSEPEPEPEPEFEPEPESELEPEPLPWRSEDQSWRGAAPANEFELNPTRVNGGSEHEPHDFASPVSSKSLEDSVKEMLRPMLKQWLDENMPRVLTAALREELENSDMQRR
jgi:cell pole-organizing protein PopZ